MSSASAPAPAPALTFAPRLMKAAWLMFLFTRTALSAPESLEALLTIQSAFFGGYHNVDLQFFRASPISPQRVPDLLVGSGRHAGGISGIYTASDSWPYYSSAFFVPLHSNTSNISWPTVGVAQGLFNNDELVDIALAFSSCSPNTDCEPQPEMVFLNKGGDSVAHMFESDSPDLEIHLPPNVTCRSIVAGSFSCGGVKQPYGMAESSRDLAFGATDGNVYFLTDFDYSFQPSADNSQKPLQVNSSSMISVAYGLNTTATTATALATYKLGLVAHPDCACSCHTVIVGARGSWKDCDQTSSNASLSTGVYATTEDQCGAQDVLISCNTNIERFGGIYQTLSVYSDSLKFFGQNQEDAYTSYILVGNGLEEGEEYAVEQVSFVYAVHGCLSSPRLLYTIRGLDGALNIRRFSTVEVEGIKFLSLVTDGQGSAILIDDRCQIEEGAPTKVSVGMVCSRTSTPLSNSRAGFHTLRTVDHVSWESAHSPLVQDQSGINLIIPLSSEDSSSYDVRGVDSISLHTEDDLRDRTVLFAFAAYDAGMSKVETCSDGCIFLLQLRISFVSGENRLPYMRGRVQSTGNPSEA